MYIQSILNPTRKYCQQGYNCVNSNIYLAPRPCDRCRKHRIKCDRNLLGCTHCSKNSKICEYKYIPKKRGPKSKLERDCQYLNSISKEFGGGKEDYISSPGSGILESPGAFNNGEFNTPHHNISGCSQFGFEEADLGLSIPPPIHPILISQYFPNLSPPQSFDPITGVSQINQQYINMYIRPNPQIYISPAFSQNPQDLYITTTKFSPNPQTVATSHCFSSNAQNLSLALSPELNQYNFDNPTIGQEIFQTSLMNTYLAPVDSLGPNYWLPMLPSCFANSTQSIQDDLHLRSNLSSMLN